MLGLTPPSESRQRLKMESTHSRQADVGDDDLVQGAGRVSLCLCGISTRVVLVLGISAGLPGLGIGSLAHSVFR